MNKIFKGIKPEKFYEAFSSAEQCYKFLADEKWKHGYTCRKCGNNNYCEGKKPYSRRCTRCKHDESATAHTVFHDCRLPITDAFRIMYSICCNPNISAYKIAKDECIRKMTCWKFRKKMIEWMETKHGIIDTAG